MTNPVDHKMEIERELNRTCNLLDPEEWADVIHLLGRLLQTQGEEESRGTAEDAAGAASCELEVTERRRWLDGAP